MIFKDDYARLDAEGKASFLMDRTHMVGIVSRAPFSLMAQYPPRVSLVIVPMLSMGFFSLE